MSVWRGILKALAGVLVLSALAVLVWRVPNGVETDLYGLVDARHGGALREIAQGLANQGRVLLEGEDFGELRREAVEIMAEFDQPPIGDFKATLKIIDGHKSGLLAPETRELMLAGRFRDVADEAAAQLFGIAPPLFSVKRDPFLLGTDYMLSLQSRLAEGWSLQEGFPVCVRGNRTFLLLTLDLSHVAAERIADFLRRCSARPAAGPVKIWCAGPPFHSARATLRAKREINVLSCISLVLVVLFGWSLFRTLTFIPRLLLAQTVGFLLATAALFAVFPRPHVLTFVFGTSLIGLSVDYVYHARAAGDVRRILRPLSCSLLTTVVCFVPLFFSEVMVLRQMALFTVAGLVAVFASQLAVGGNGAGLTGRGAMALSIGGWWKAIVVAVALVGVFRIHVVTDPAAFYRPDAELTAGERMLAELSPGQARSFAFVPGATLQEALEREEDLGLKGVSAIVPSLRRQRENAALVAKLYVREGSNYTARTGLKIPREDSPSFLRPEDLEDGPLKQMVRTMYVGGGLISPLVDGMEVPAGVEVLDPRASLEGLFEQFTAATLKLLVLSVVVFALLLLVVFRRRCLRFAMPVLLSQAATAGVLGWVGVPVTFFTLLCFFVLAGLGIDYSIFHRGNPTPGTGRTVFYSFLTSFAGLGMLAFTNFPVTRSMGITFAVGLFFAYLFSCERSAGSGSEGKAWHEQGEQSAGAFRLGFMWWTYSCLGKNVLKLLCVPVMACIYPFATPARRALRAFYRTLSVTPTSWELFRHLLGFAWSLADKTDACTLQKNLPRMSICDDEDWRDFRELMAAHQGAFLISTHLGTIEVLPALTATALPSSPSSPLTASHPLTLSPPPRVHAFQQLGHNAVFTRMFMRHFDDRAFTMHAVEDIGVETAVAMQQAIVRGELVLMAGDRLSAGSPRKLMHDFLGRRCGWPKGVFTFAKLMESPVFFVTCVRTGWNAYECRFRRFRNEPGGSAGEVTRMLDQYVAFLEAETRKHPEQWYHFHDFFGNMV